MKKTIFILFALFCSCLAFAQDNEITEKMSALEAKISTMEHAIAAMQTKVDEVTRQNLALKQAISLEPTIAEMKTDDGLDYRLIKAVGNRQTGRIALSISVMNTTKRDINLQFEPMPNIVDEQGNSYNDYKLFAESKIANNHFSSITQLLPDAPVNFELTFVADTEPQYIKVLHLESYNKAHSMRFTNIPIKWE